MKKTTLFSLLSLFIAAGFSACNSNGNNTTTTDSTSTTTTTTTTSTGNYAARADSLRINSQAGDYLNPRTGKNVTLTMDTTTGAITDETGRPVKRYVDKRTWHVYDAATGDTVGSAQMSNGNLMYRGTTGDWETYDKRWSDDTTSMNTVPMTTDSSMSTSGGSSSSSTGTSGSHGKVKVKDHGDKVKTVEKTKG